jgi:energy-coupling factor transporter transmembrane protein EcfT
METATWVSNYQSQLAEPFIASRVRWDTEEPTRKQFRKQLDNSFPRTAVDGRTEWVVERHFARNYRIRTTDGGLEVVRRFSPAVRLFLLGVVVLSPVLVQSVESIALYVGVPGVLTYGMYTDPPAPACTEIVYENANGLLGVALVLGVLTAVVQTMGLESRWPVLVICGLVTLIVVVLMYLLDGLPFVVPNLNKRVLRIPFSFLASAAGSLMLFFPLVFFAAYLESLGETLGEYAAGETSRATASVLADAIGGFGTTDPTPEMVRNAVIDAFGPVVYFIGLVAVVVAGLSLHEAKPTLESLQRYRLDTFATGWRRRVALVLFLAVNVAFYVATAVAFGIIAYGVVGTYYLPEWTLQPLVGYFPTELRIPPRDFLQALYTTLDLTVPSVPGVPARVLSVGFLFAVLWPFAFITFGTLTQAIGRPYRTLQVLWNSSPVTDDRVQDSVGDDVEVRHIDRDGYPDLRPFTLLGHWKFVFVSDVLIEECGPDELEALLRHEEYHIRERGPGTAAVVLALFVGGANAIAAFYDFRKSERKADEEAAAAVGRAPLRHAIIRAYDLRARAPRNPIPGHTPSAVSPLPALERTDTATTAGRTRLGRLLTLIWGYLLAPYQLYFGGVLTETAHLRKRERLEALRPGE